MTDGVPQLTFQGPKLQAGPDSVEALSREFQDHRCVTVPQLLSPALVSWLHQQLASAAFVARSHAGMESTELCLEDCTCLGLLAFLVNDPLMLRFVEQVSGQPALTRFMGRVYSRVPGVHGDAWHDDIRPDRLVGMSINLSAGVYGGGVFEIRETATQRPLGAIANTGFGDAILFAIDEALQHRVSPLSGTIAKTAYAGWFGAAHDYNADLRRRPDAMAR
jgi:hypothetical protein